MRLRVYSDLHLEFAPLAPAPVDDVDVVVLAGDIHTKAHGVAWARAAFPETPVLYVPGNHEYYGAAIPHHTAKLRAAAAGSNVRVVDEEAVVLGGVRFLCATLWTDFCVSGPERRDLVGETARAKMNDFRRVRTSPPLTPSWSKLTPRAVYGLHLRARVWLREQLALPFSGPTVVVTHHAPTLLSVAPHQRADELCGAYVSDLHALLDGRARLWIHGHTHHNVDVDVSGTRVFANQRGYPDDRVDGFDAACVVDV